ncbi:MAG: hypothetical protein M1839_004118, partial [Geoglossum umbratile]
MPHSIGQYCKWHAFENIKKLLFDRSYSKEQQNHLKPLIWSYLKTTSLNDFQAARADILKALKPSEAGFLKKNWFPKEKFVCRSSTQHLPNLGVHSTQQAESMNAVLKESLLCQISLIEACKHLTKHVRSFEAKLLAEETTSRTTRPRLLDMNGFATLLGKISNYAILLMAPEWSSAAVPRPDSIWQ